MCQEKRYFFTCIVILVIGLMLTGWVEQAQTQEKYPTGPIEIIVPFNPGGATDTSARIMADYLSKKWRVPINIVNKPGGVRIPACLELYRAKPDGYTLMQDTQGSSSQLPTAVKDVPFNIMDRTFIATIGCDPTVYLVHPDSPIKSLKDLEAEIKKDPGNFTWASLGGAGPYDWCMRKFLKAIGVDVTKTRPVTVKGGTEATSLTAAKSVKLGFSTFSSGGPSITAKIVRALAVTDDVRDPNYPDIPTTAEAGYPDCAHTDRYSPVGPPNVPSHIVEVWDRAIEEMVKDPEVVSKLKKLGIRALYLNGRETRERCLKEMEEIKELWGIK
jgi:tripartite-type tricarboxylate transporter receptor subunit TctC